MRTPLALAKLSYGRDETQIDLVRLRNRVRRHAIVQGSIRDCYSATVTRSLEATHGLVEIRSGNDRLALTARNPGVQG